MFDLETIVRFVAAFALVVGMIALASYAARRWRASVGVKGRGGRRLQMVEGLAIDAKRRLVLVRADGSEHLLLVGGDSDLLISSQPLADSPQPQPETSSQ